MSRMSFVRVGLALALVVYGVPGWLSAQQARAPKNTLSASSDEVKRFGIARYRVHEAQAEGHSIRLGVDLVGSANEEVGKWVELRSIDGASRETTLELDGHKVLSMVTGKQATLVVDGAEILTITEGETVSSSEQQQSIARYANFLEIISRVRREVEPMRKVAERFLHDWNQTGFAPAPLRPLAIALYRLLPKGQVLSASAMDEGPGCSLEYDSCGSDFDEVRSGACVQAANEANNGCSDWVWCLGCCSMGACDCACVSGDYFCWCTRCGARCTPPI